MNYKKFYLISILPMLLFPTAVFATLSVQFENTPLFSEANLLPGDAVERVVTVSNTGVETETLEFTFENVVSGDLADYIELAVTNGSTVFVFDTFANLFASGPYSLGTVNPNETKTFTFTAAFPSNAGNILQNEWFSFDIRIGFVGETQITDRNTGGSSGTQTLRLFNEIATEADSMGGAFITWNSNRRASTYLICGNLENGPFILTEESPLFGYEFAISEQELSTTTHGFAVSDMVPGDYECRPAGREAGNQGFTVGSPVWFTVAGPPGQVEGISDSLSEAEIQELLVQIIATQPQGSVFGASSKGTGGLTYEEFEAGLKTLKTKEDSTETATLMATEQTKTTIDPDSNEMSGDVDNKGKTNFLYYLLVPLLLMMVITVFNWLRKKGK